MKKLTIYTCIIVLLTTITFIIALGSLKIEAYSEKNINTQKHLSLSSRENYNLTLSPIEELEISEEFETQNEIIEKVNNIISKLNVKNTAEFNLEKSIITKKYDTLKNYEYYQVNKGNYIINIKEDDGTLCGIYNNNFNYNKQNSGTFIDAHEFILNMYSELNLPQEYVLNYLEQFDETLWEADFCDICDGIANPYSSVKILFSPETKEISALTVFNESYKGDDEVQINEEDAIDIVSKSRAYFRK